MPNEGAAHQNIIKYQQFTHNDCPFI